MSADEQLTEQEKAVLSYTSDENSGETVETQDVDVDGRLQRLEAAFETLQQDLAETKRALEAERQHKRDLVAKVNQLEDKVDGNTSLVGQSTLEKYSLMDDEDREDLLPPSQQRAVEIYEHWDDLAWRADGTPLMETKARANAKHNPSKIKYRLEKQLNKDLAWNEIYRAMKAVAKLSGGEEETDAQNRLHIKGGRFEYHVVPTADNSDTRRVLKEVDE